MERTVSSEATEQTAISVEKFNLYYGKFHALIDVNMKVNKQEVTAIIGPSGCGKSTLIRSFNRMNDVFNEVHIEGNMIIDDEPIYGKNVDLINLRQKIGMVFQRPNPFPLSLFENVAFGLRVHFALPKSEIQDRVESSLRAVGLWDRVKDKLRVPALSLANEEKQRLCIARTIAINPEIVLMDEPCSALDPEATQRVEELTRELKEKYTIVIVTHNMAQAARVSDRTAYFYLGRLIEMGPTERIFTRPEKKETEDYITGRFG